MDKVVEAQAAPIPEQTSIQLTYVDQSGHPHQVKASVGESLMKVATRNRIAGVDADCGGKCACGTCRVRILEPGVEDLAPAGAEEQGLLRFIGDERHLDCRLGCQVKVTPSLANCTVVVVSDDGT